jgi:hypothetical protein
MIWSLRWSNPVSSRSTQTNVVLSCASIIMPTSLLLLLLGGLMLVAEATSYLNPSKVSTSPPIELQTNSGLFTASNTASFLLWIYPMTSPSASVQLITWDVATGKTLYLTRKA